MCISVHSIETEWKQINFVHTSCVLIWYVSNQSVHCRYWVPHVVLIEDFFAYLVVSINLVPSSNPTWGASSVQQLRSKLICTKFVLVLVHIVATMSYQNQNVDSSLMGSSSRLYVDPIVLKWAASWQNQQNYTCAQQWLRSAWASAQSDQSLRCTLNV